MPPFAVFNINCATDDYSKLQVMGSSVSLFNWDEGIALSEDALALQRLCSCPRPDAAPTVGARTPRRHRDARRGCWRHPASNMTLWCPAGVACVAAVILYGLAAASSAVANVPRSAPVVAVHERVPVTVHLAAG